MRRMAGAGAFHLMLRRCLAVVRGDDHVCQKCCKYATDSETKFDHVIPVSKDGPTSVEEPPLAVCEPTHVDRSPSLNPHVLRSWRPALGEAP